MAKFMFDQNGEGNTKGAQQKTHQPSRSHSPEELIDFKKLFSLLAQYKWLILFFLLLSVSGCYYLVNHYLLPVYQSQATVLISADENTLPSSNENLGRILSNTFDPNVGGGTVQNAIHMIQSRELANEVANQIQDLRAQPNGEVYPILWVSFPEDTTLASEETIASRIRSGLSVEPVEPGSNLLKVSYQSYSPYESARIINIAINAFQDLSLEKKRRSAQNALSFLREEKEKVRSQLTQAEEQLSRFMNEKELVNLESQTSNLVGQLSSLEAERQSLRIQLESVNSAINKFEKQVESIKPGLADQYSKAVGPTISRYQQRLAELKTEKFVLISNNPQLKENPNSEPELRRLNQQIAELENEIQSLSKEMLANSENLGFMGDNSGNISQELSKIQNRLTELRIQKNQYEAQIKVLDQRIQETRVFLDRVPENRIQMARLERQVEMYKELFNTISKQEAEMALWEQTQSSNGSIVDHATTNNDPVKPRKPLSYAIAVLIGLALPVGFLLVKDYFTSVIESAEQLKSFSYPLLSVIYDHSLIEGRGWSLNKDKKKTESVVSEELVLHRDSFTPIAESYRRLVGQLMYANPDFVPKKILVTSSGPEEGKTTLTGNIAAALAEIDKKVLIIDCDLRRPATHRLFGLSRTPGVNEVIFEDTNVAEGIRSTEISNLFVLPAGKNPVSNSRLLSSKKFNKMIEVLNSNYDIILFDSPPFGVVSDIAPLVGLSDVTILAAKFKQTKEKILKHTLEDLEKTNARNVGLVLTMYKPKKSKDSYETKDLHKYMYQEYYDYERSNKQKEKKT